MTTRRSDILAIRFSLVGKELVGRPLFMRGEIFTLAKDCQCVESQTFSWMLEDWTAWRGHKGSKSRGDTNTHYDAKQFDNCRSLEWKHPKKDDDEGSEKKRGKRTETTSSFRLRFFITSEACCHGLCLDEIQVAGHQPHSVDWPWIPYQRATFFVVSSTWQGF